MKKGSAGVVIIGAGFAGLFAARKLSGKNVRITLIDRNNYHTFNPLLYQVGASEIDPEQIAYPVRSIIRGMKNVTFMMTGVKRIKTKENVVITDAGPVDYDYLIVAPGSRVNYYGIPGAEENSISLKSLEDALELRNRILSSFELAVRTDSREEREKNLTFVIAGGGATGVEFAGAFAELVHGPLKKDFPSIKKSEVRIILIDSGKKLIPAYTEKSGDYAERKLVSKGVKVLLNSEVVRMDNGSIKLKSGERISSSTIVWTAGVKGAELQYDVKIPLSRDSRVIVDQTLRVENIENVFFCGDMAAMMKEGDTLPMVAPVATQQGEHTALNILRLIERKNAGPFRYSDRGGMVAIGRNSAVTRIGRRELRGLLAWFLWLFIHIFYLIGFRNKVLVMMSWFIDYILYERTGRMIIPVRGGRDSQSIR